MTSNYFDDLFSDLENVEGGWDDVPPEGEPLPPPVAPPPVFRAPVDEAPSNSDSPKCVVCGRDIPYSGRGRKPKYCMDDKPTATRAPKDGPVTTTRRKAGTDLQHELQKGIGEFAATIVPFMPVTSVTMAMRGPDAIDALIGIAQEYPAMLKGLETAAKVRPWLALGTFVAAIALAASVDFNVLAPTGVASDMLGVTTAAQRAGYRPPAPREPRQAKPAQQAGPGLMDRSKPLPPRFEM